MSCAALKKNCAVRKYIFLEIMKCVHKLITMKNTGVQTVRKCSRLSLK